MSRFDNESLLGRVWIGGEGRVELEKVAWVSTVSSESIKGKLLDVWRGGDRAGN
jgi:hypothetical protein